MKLWVHQPKVLLFIVCIMVVACYWAGTSGGFVFDDMASLPQLGYHNTIDSLEKLKAFVFGGITGPGGRPVALLTFAANAQTWPAHAYYFIVTNIAIHVVNTVLLFWFLNVLFATALPQLRHKKVIIITACALWALHPFHISTVLYIVQRMTLLAATFSLLTFIAYLYARRDLLAGRYVAGMVMLGGAALSAALGFFSKEIVILLPLQLLLIELLCTVNNSAKRNRALTWLFWGSLVPAAIIVVGYPVKMIVANTWHLITTGSELDSTRSFTMFERLLTEQRVVGDYIADLLVPKMQSSGVFYDGYSISTNLLTPFSTLVWMLLHVTLLLGSFFFRRKVPMLFFCVWWFYVGHLIESTAPMLEIKFDHRNYLPSIGLLLLMAWAISSLKKDILKKSISIGLVLVYAALLFMGASLWGKPLTAAMVWIEKNPNSPRALEHAASLYLNHHGASKEAEALLMRSIKIAPKVDAELKFMGVFCKTYNSEPLNWAELATRVQKSSRDWSLYPTLELIIDNYINNKCPDLDLTGYLSVLQAYQNNPAYSKTMSYYLMDDLAIKASLAFDNPKLAKEYANKANINFVPLAFQMNRALFFANKGDVVFAADLLKRAITIAEQLKNESDFTITNAKEILQLMQADLNEAQSE